MSVFDNSTVVPMSIRYRHDAGKSIISLDVHLRRFSHKQLGLPNQKTHGERFWDNATIVLFSEDGVQIDEQRPEYLMNSDAGHYALAKFEWRRDYIEEICKTGVLVAQVKVDDAFHPHTHFNYFPFWRQP